MKDYSFSVGETAKGRLHLLDEVHGPYSRKIVNEFLSLVALRKDSTIVDAGCGTGEMLHFFSEKFDAVIGLDNSKDQLKIAEYEMQRKGMNNVELCCESIITSEKILGAELIYARFILHHLLTPLDFLKRIKNNKKHQYGIIEEVDHSSWNSIPSNELVNLASDMFVEFGRFKNRDYTLGNHISELAFSIGLKIHAIEFSQPVCIGENTDMLYLVINECRDELSGVYGSDKVHNLLKKLEDILIKSKKSILIYPKITHLLISNG